jgi:hypothetical protein
MAKYKTAQGKTVDIEKLKLVNERTIAVGNMKVNARGDQLGHNGQIIATRNEVMNQQYKIQGTVVGGNKPITRIENVAPDGESFDPPDFEEDIKPIEPKLRGNLADSIAKQTTVDQKTLDPNMHKNNGNKGPQRI